MNGTIFKTTKLIAKAFKKRDIKFTIEDGDEVQIVTTAFGLEGGVAVIQFFVRNHGNGVFMRIHHLIADVPADRRIRIMQVCNTINDQVRFLRFSLDRENGINIGYDFPNSTPDNAIGDLVFEMFVRTIMIVESHYPIFVRTLYTDIDLDAAMQDAAHQMVSLMRDAVSAHDSANA